MPIAAGPIESKAVVLTRNAGAIIRFVDEAIVDMLGWAPDQLVGRPSTEFIHPDDQPSAIAVWMEMLTEPGSRRVWRGRYRAADGSWRLVETINENRLDSTDEVVRTSMTRVVGEQIGIEEEPRARKQILNRAGRR